jgi:hypothetical protein
LDIDHILRVQNKSQSHTSNALFASQLRGYQPSDLNLLNRKKFDPVFSREKTILEKKCGQMFLPPINETCKKQMDRIPHLKSVVNKKNILSERQRKDMIFAIDPNNLSMPKYSSKYHNEKNAAAFRHLLGGRVDGVTTG